MIALPRPSWRLLAIVGGAVVVVAALAAGLWLWSEAQARTATAAHADALALLSQARAKGAAAGDARAAALRAIEAALAAYPSASLAAQSALELGNARYADRDWVRARAAWTIAGDRARSATVRTLARGSIGYAWEAERNWPKAAEAFRAALSDLEPGDFHYEELMIDLGRVQEQAGEKPAAIETYRRLLKEVPTSLRADDVRTRLASLGAAP